MKNLLFILFLLPALSFAGEIKIIVIDKELDFPLEGVKVSLKGDRKVSALTDEEGTAVLNLSDSLSEGEFVLTLPGYKEQTVKFTSADSELTVLMSIAGLIEGNELVVNRSAPEKAGEKTGVSTVITKEEMHTTANVGLVEDCMSSVRTLPGVSFGGSSWGSEPSVRGGEPRELAFFLDGMCTIYPYHWGGGVSIFNPAMIESMQLSNGVFSAKFGRGSSGIIDASTIKPDFENCHVNLNLSTTCADAFVQIPFGKNTGGMILGTHLTYLDPLVWAVKKSGSHALDSITQAPYIRDFFFKTNLTPRPELDISVTGFLGSDGLGIDQSETVDDITTHAVFDYDIYQALAGLKVKYLASDRLFFQGLLSYNGMYEDLEMTMSENGTVSYNDEFVDKYGSAYSEVTYGGTYTLPNLTSSSAEKIKSHLVTARLETELELNENNHLAAGIDEVLSTADTTEKMSGWTDIEVADEHYFRKVSFDSVNNGNRIFDHSIFLCWNYGKEKDFFQSEAGVRGEIVNIFNSENDYSLFFLPDVSPRVSVTLTPWRDRGKLEKCGITFGAGLFSSIPRETMILTKDMGLKDFDMHTNRSLMGVIGADASLEGGWKFKLESYYKHYLSRIYVYESTDSSSDYQDVSMHAKSNGKGYVFGLDALIENKSGRRWDGYLSYSFVNSRLYNPAGIAAGEYAEGMYGSPFDEWFYPYYHRFHTANLVSNWHFGAGWVFTVKATFATGTPDSKKGDIVCYASRLDDGTVIQRYTRTSHYSDTLRTNITCPIDLRIAKQWKSKNEKRSYEFYFALQDLNFIPQKTEESFNSYTGKSSEIDDQADYSLGIPIPSLGFKMKF